MLTLEQRAKLTKAMGWEPHWDADGDEWISEGPNPESNPADLLELGTWAVNQPWCGFVSFNHACCTIFDNDDMVLSRVNGPLNEAFPAACLAALDAVGEE